MKKTCYSTKVFYNIINQKNIFGKFNKADEEIAECLEIEAKEPHDSRDSDEGNLDYEDSIFNYDIDFNKTNEFFDFIHINNRNRTSCQARSSKALDFIKRKKNFNISKLQKIKEKLNKVITDKNTVHKVKTLRSINTIRTTKGN